jgi:lipopolysaccharide/colanic/teichoic acid biosynthesis glycosyltransferase
MMLKRSFDIIFSIIGIVSISPFLLIIFWFVVFESKGGFIYKQKRVGKNNVDFKLQKIRTMFPNSDKKGLLTIGEKDSRITRVGYILRKYKLDELPQLFNILFGDMSFVGPRPEVRKYIAMYNTTQLKILSIKPGLTDFASILFYDENKFLSKFENPEEIYINIVMPRKLFLNLKYIENRSFCLDLKIIFKTVFKWVIK